MERCPAEAHKAANVGELRITEARLWALLNIKYPPSRDEVPPADDADGAIDLPPPPAVARKRRETLNRVTAAAAPAPIGASAPLARPFPASDVSTHGFSQSDAERRVRQRLCRFYAHYNPTKLASVEKIARTFASCERQLFEKLVKQYGPEPPEAITASEDLNDALLSLPAKPQTKKPPVEEYPTAFSAGAAAGMTPPSTQLTPSSTPQPTVHSSLLPKPNLERRSKRPSMIVVESEAGEQILKQEVFVALSPGVVEREQINAVLERCAPRGKSSSVSSRLGVPTTVSRLGSRRNSLQSLHSSRVHSGTTTPQAQPGHLVSPVKSPQSGSRAGSRSGSRMGSRAPTPTPSEQEATRVKAEQEERERKKQKQLKRYKNKQHPLLSLPKEPWRIKVRAILFPSLHRQACIVNDQPMPAGEPRFGDWFENFMIIAIFFNVIVLALFDPYAPSGTTRQKLVFTAQVVLTFVFQVELALRVIALGLRRMLTPLRLLDGGIVLGCTIAIIADLAGSPNRFFGISVLRTPRLLRPLQDLGQLQAVVVLVEALTSCLVKIGDVTMLFLVFVLIFSVASIGVFGGSMTTRCFNDWYNASWLLNVSFPEFNYTGIEDFICGGRFDSEVLRHRDDWQGCFPDQVCEKEYGFGLRGFNCPYGYTCLPFENPSSGFVGFDNIAMSFLTLFVSSSQQLWFQIAGDAADATDVVAYVYMSLFLIFCILLINLMIVIISVEFDLAKTKAQRRVRDDDDKNDGLVGQFTRGVGAMQDIMGNLMSMKLLDNAPESPKAVQMASAAARDAIDFTAEKTSQFVKEMRRLVSLYCVDRNWFWYATTALIIVNVVALSFYRFGMNDTWVTVLSWFNVVLTVAFTTESALRFLATDVKGFVDQRMNIFDVVVNTFGWLDILLENSSFKFLSAFRVIRTLKLLRISPGVHKWLVFILASVKASPIILFLLFFVVMIFSLMCMQLLGGRLCGLDPESRDNPPECVGRPRYNFDDFGHALITAFQLITGDNWNDVMVVAMQARGWAMGLLFSLYFYLGNYILLSIFIGILLAVKTDDVEAEEKRRQAREAADQRAKDIETGAISAEQAETEANPNLSDGAALSAGGPSAGAVQDRAEQLLKHTAVMIMKKHVENRHAKRGFFVLGAFTDGVALLSGKTEEELEAEEEARAEKGRTHDLFLADQEEYSNWWEVRRHHMQRILRPVMQSLPVSLITVGVIISATVAMSLRNPIAAPDTTLSFVCDFIDTFTKVFYIVEVVLNVCAYGLWKKKETYLKRDRWNIFDAFIAFIGFVALIIKQTKAKSTLSYRLLNSLTALRPLSLVKRSASMNLVARALGSAVFEMRFVVAAVFVVVFVFAVVGTNLFMGTMRSCFAPGTWSELPDLSLENCTALGGSWENAGPNFDNIINSLFSLFVVMTLELWSEVMYRAMDYDGPGLPLKANASTGASFYFIIFAVVGGFVCVNIFMSVLVDCYNRCKRTAHAQRTLLSSREVNGWEGTNARLLRAMPKVCLARIQSLSSPTTELEKAFASSTFAKSLRRRANLDSIMSSWRVKLREAVEHRHFTNAIYVVIFVSFAAMAAEYHPSSPDYKRGLFIVQEVCSVLFVAEAIAKIVAETAPVYFASNWNRFDFFVVVVSVITLAFGQFVSPRIGSIFRALRVLRLAKIMSGKSSLSELVQKFAKALTNLGSVIAICTVWFFMFAIAGMSIFGRVHWQDRGSSTIGHSSNFSTIGMALFMLLRVTFGGDWWYVWWHLKQHAEGCEERLGTCGPPEPVPSLFFFVFIAFAMFVLKNLLVAVLIDQFSSAADLRAMSKPQAKIFMAQWAKFDPELKMRLKGFDVLPFLRTIPARAPIGFMKFSQQKRVALELRCLMLLKIDDPHSVENGVTFEHLVDLLCHMAYECAAPPERPLKMPREKFFGAEDPTSEGDFVEMLSAEERKKKEEESEDRWRLSATLITINEVAKRVLANRRKRQRREERDALLEELEELEAEFPDFDDGEDLEAKARNGELTVEQLAKLERRRTIVQARRRAQELESDTDNESTVDVDELERRLEAQEEKRRLRGRQTSFAAAFLRRGDEALLESSSDEERRLDSKQKRLLAVTKHHHRHIDDSDLDVASPSLEERFARTTATLDKPNTSSESDADSEDSITPFFKLVKKETERSFVGRTVKRASKSFDRVSDAVATGAAKSINAVAKTVAGREIVAVGDAQDVAGSPDKSAALPSGATSARGLHDATMSSEDDLDLPVPPLRQPARRRGLSDYKLVPLLSKQIEDEADVVPAAAVSRTVNLHHEGTEALQSVLEGLDDDDPGLEDIAVPVCEPRRLRAKSRAKHWRKLATVAAVASPRRRRAHADTPPPDESIPGTADLEMAEVLMLRQLL